MASTWRSPPTPPSRWRTPSKESLAHSSTGSSLDRVVGGRLLPPEAAAPDCMRDNKMVRSMLMLVCITLPAILAAGALTELLCRKTLHDRGFLFFLVVHHSSSTTPSSWGKRARDWIGKRVWKGEKRRASSSSSSWRPLCVLEREALFRSSRGQGACPISERNSGRQENLAHPGP